MISMTEGCSVSPRNSRSKSGCASRSVTSTPFARQQQRQHRPAGAAADDAAGGPLYVLDFTRRRGFTGSRSLPGYRPRSLSLHRRLRHSRPPFAYSRRGFVCVAFRVPFAGFARLGCRREQVAEVTQQPISAYRLAAEADVTVRPDEVQRLRSGSVVGLVQLLLHVQQNRTVPVQVLGLVIASDDHVSLYVFAPQLFELSGLSRSGSRSPPPFVPGRRREGG